jgi:Spy/CpxP family protein refolding chaperone
MKNLILAVIAVVLFATLGFDAKAHPRGAAFEHGPGIGMPDPALMIEQLADHLDLDDAQRERVQSILEAVQAEAEALRTEGAANREALQALDTNDPGYETELNNLALSQGRLATEGLLLATRVRNEINAVLTDEQQEKLARGKERMKKAFARRSRQD